MKILAPMIVVILAVAAIAVLLSSSKPTVQQEPQKKLETVLPIPSQTPENIDYTASFQIFTNGTKRSFTAAMYHNLSDQAYLTSDDPEIVYVKSKITWQEFFDTLPFKVTPDCLTTGTGQKFCTNSISDLNFYLNGQLEPQTLNQYIQKGDVLIIKYENKNI